VFTGAGVRCAGAQVVAHSQLSPICHAGAGPRISEDDHLIVVRAGTAWNRHVYTVEESTRITQHANALQQHFTPPGTLGDVPILAESWLTAWGGAPFLHSAVNGMLVLVMKPRGSVRAAFWQIAPFSTVFAKAVTDAVATADSAGAFLGIPRADPLLRDDTLVVQIRTAPASVGGDEFPLMRARLRRYEVDVPPRIVKRGRLIHPRNVMYGRNENFGEVVALIGSDGRAVSGSTQVSRIERPGFVQTMQRYVDKSVYEPARSGGCAVPSLFLHSFDFATEP
jgi:hypothetical protein